MHKIYLGDRGKDYERPLGLMERWEVIHVAYIAKFRGVRVPGSQFRSATENNNTNNLSKVMELLL